MQKNKQKTIKKVIELNQVSQSKHIFKQHPAYKIALKERGVGGERILMDSEAEVVVGRAKTGQKTEGHGRVLNCFL